MSIYQNLWDLLIFYKLCYQLICKGNEAEGEGEARKSAEPFQAISYASDKLFSTAAQLHFFFDLGFKSAHKYWNYKLKEMVLFDAWPISKNCSNGKIMAEVSPFQCAILPTIRWPFQ